MKKHTHAGRVTDSCLISEWRGGPVSDLSNNIEKWVILSQAGPGKPIRASSSALWCVTGPCRWNSFITVFSERKLEMSPPPFFFFLFWACQWVLSLMKFCEDSHRTLTGIRCTQCIKILVRLEQKIRNHEDAFDRGLKSAVCRLKARSSRTDEITVVRTQTKTEISQLPSHYATMKWTLALYQNSLWIINVVKLWTTTTFSIYFHPEPFPCENNGSILR